MNAETLDAIGEPEHVSVGRMADDFCIDENSGVAYVTTHRENTIDCVSLNPAKNTDLFIVAGDPLNEEFVGPSSAAWGRLPGEYGKVAFVTTDGGSASPLPDGVRRPAKLFRLEFSRSPRGPTIVDPFGTVRCRIRKASNTWHRTDVAISFMGSICRGRGPATEVDRGPGTAQPGTSLLSIDVGN